jgi:hypothetical protein
MAINHLANAGIGIYIDADSVAGDNRNWLRPRAHVSGSATLYIQNIIAGRQRHTMVAVPIRGHSRDFFFPSRLRMISGYST